MKNEMSIEEMRNYKGSFPKPQDHREFWDRMLDKIKDFKPEYEINKYTDEEFLNMELYELRFRSYDGASVYAKYLRPKNVENAPCILHFHGYPSVSRPYTEQSSYVDGGFAVIAMDCRNQGGKTIDAGNVYQGIGCMGDIILGVDGPLEEMYYVRVFMDICVLVKTVKQMEGIDKDRIYVNGGSQGGALSVACAALNPDDIKKACIQYPFLSDLKRVYNLDWMDAEYAGLKYYAKKRDPEGLRTDEFFTKLGYIDVRNFADYIKADTIFGISLADRTVAPSTQYSVYNNMMCKKELFEYPQYGHDDMHPFDAMIIPFLQGKEYHIKKEDYCDGKFNYIDRGYKANLLYLGYELNIAGPHFLRRFAVLGYNVYCFCEKMDDYDKRLQDILDFIDGHENTVIVAEAKLASLACVAASKRNIKLLSIQSAIDMAEFEIREAFEQIECPILMCVGGLDENKEFNEELSTLNENAEIHVYPKYGDEYIHAYDEMLMFRLNTLAKEVD